MPPKKIPSSGNPRPLIGQKLRELRLSLPTKISVRQASRNMDCPNPNVLSLYERGRTGFSDEKLMEILSIGLKIPLAEARHIAGRWIIEEKAQKYGLSVTFLNENPAH